MHICETMIQGNEEELECNVRVRGKTWVCWELVGLRGESHRYILS